MELIDFFQRVLPPEGTYFVATQNKSGGYFKQQAAQDLNSLQALVNIGVQNDQATYFATGSFKDATSRTAKNVALKKSVYLDMDCGPDKDFVDQKDAVRKLYEFCEEAEVPRPNILVNSGNGVHAYWTLEESIPTEDWLPLAEGLSALCDEYEFPADNVVTADGARILRAPSSINKKDPSNPRKCTVLGGTRPDYSLASLRVAFKRHATPMPEISSILPEVDANDLSDAALKQREWYAKYMITACPTLKYIKETGGKDCNEPLWMQTLNLLAYCEDGDNYIHPVSNGHPTYDSRMTEFKFKARLEAKEEGKSGPTLCKTFARYPQAKCASCPHKDVIKSPITLGREPPPSPDQLPYPYKQDDNGIYMIKEGERYSICRYRIEAFEVRRNAATGEFVRYVEFSVAGSQKFKLTIDKPALQNLKAHLELYGMYINDNEIKGMKQVMTSWASQLQAAKQVKTLHSQFGWDGSAFITGAGRYDKDGLSKSEMADANLKHTYSPTGDIEVWKQAASAIVKNDYVELHAMLASAFAAPLLNFSSVNGTILSIVSKQSGTGKTSAMRTAQAVWGHPIHGINSLNDTPNSVAHRMGTLNNLPLYWDELRQRKEITDFLNLVFRAGQGRDKTRLTASSQQMATGSWRTMIAVASNAPLKDYVDMHVGTTDAGMLRIFEMEMKRSANREYDPVTSALFTKLDSNYGLAGQVYAEWLAANHGKLQSMLVSIENQFIEAINVEQHQRFWISTMAGIYLGAAIARKLELVDFDLPALKQCLIDTAIRMRDVARSSVNRDDDDEHTAYDLVQQFIIDMDDHTYITEHFPDHKGEVGQFIKLPNRGPVKIYISKEDGMAQLDKAAFRKWLKDNRHPMLSTTNELKEHFGATEGRVMLSPKYGSGDSTNLRTYAIKIPLRD